MFVPFKRRKMGKNVRVLIHLTPNLTVKDVLHGIDPQIRAFRPHLCSFFVPFGKSEGELRESLDPFLSQDAWQVKGVYRLGVHSRGRSSYLQKLEAARLADRETVFKEFFSNNPRSSLSAAALMFNKLASIRLLEITDMLARMRRIPSGLPRDLKKRVEGEKELRYYVRLPEDYAPLLQLIGNLTSNVSVIRPSASRAPTFGMQALLRSSNAIMGLSRKDENFDLKNERDKLLLARYVLEDILLSHPKLYPESKNALSHLCAAALAGKLSYADFEALSAKSSVLMEEEKNSIVKRGFWPAWEEKLKERGSALPRSRKEMIKLVKDTFPKYVFEFT
ncbi:MAG: hypothetical protein V1811_00510 [Candidatus Micrarchaeota archaeon]